MGKHRWNRVEVRRDLHAPLPLGRIDDAGRGKYTLCLAHSPVQSQTRNVTLSQNTTNYPNWEFKNFDGDNENRYNQNELFVLAATRECGCGNAFDRVCLCLFVYLSSFELLKCLDPESSFSVCRYIFRISKSCSYIKFKVKVTAAKKWMYERNQTHIHGWSAFDS